MNKAVADSSASLLADGNQVPMLGLGVWQVPDRRECVNAVHWVCVPRIPSTGCDLQGCSSSRPAVMIIDHVPSVRLPPDHTDDILAAGVPA